MQDFTLHSSPCHSLERRSLFYLLIDFWMVHGFPPDVHGLCILILPLSRSSKGLSGPLVLTESTPTWLSLVYLQVLFSSLIHNLEPSCPLIDWYFPTSVCLWQVSERKATLSGSDLECKNLVDTLIQWFSTFPKLQTFNTVPHVVVNPRIKSCFVSAS